MGKANKLPGQNPFQIILVNPATANFNPTGTSPSAGFCDKIGSAGVSTECKVLMPVDVVRYQIAPDADDPGLPALWRSSTGRFSAAGVNIGAPASGNGNWQVVARGIEDLQVEYMNGGLAWNPTPGEVYCSAPCNDANPPLQADLLRVIRQVRVTLSARATGRARIQGTTTGAGNAGNAIRGQLVAVMVPRAALSALT